MRKSRREVMRKNQKTDEPEQDVPRFNVTVQNAVLMRVIDCAGDLCDQFRRLPDGQRGSSDYFIKLTTFDKLHAEVAWPISLADFVDWNDSWMLQARGGFSFAAKAFQVRFACPLTKTNDL
jgi:hypothetical protein